MGCCTSRADRRIVKPSGSHIKRSFFVFDLRLTADDQHVQRWLQIGHEQLLLDIRTSPEYVVGYHCEFKIENKGFISKRKVQTSIYLYNGNVPVPYDEARAQRFEMIYSTYFCNGRLKLGVRIHDMAITGPGKTVFVANTRDVDQKLAIYAESGEFADASLLSANGQVTKVHKIVLALHSPVLAAFWRRWDRLESKESTYDLSDFDEPTVQRYIRLCYQNEVESQGPNDINEVLTLLDLGDRLDTKLVIDACATWITALLDRNTLMTVIKWGTACPNVTLGTRIKSLTTEYLRLHPEDGVAILEIDH